MQFSRKSSRLPRRRAVRGFAPRPPERSRAAPPRAPGPPCEAASGRHPSRPPTAPPQPSRRAAHPPRGAAAARHWPRPMRQLQRRVGELDQAAQQQPLDAVLRRRLPDRLPDLVRLPEEALDIERSRRSGRPCRPATRRAPACARAAFAASSGARSGALPLPGTWARAGSGELPSQAARSILASPCRTRMRSTKPPTVSSVSSGLSRCGAWPQPGSSTASTGQ